MIGWNSATAPTTAALRRRSSPTRRSAPRAGQKPARVLADSASVRRVRHGPGRGRLLSADGYTGRVKAVGDEPSHALPGFTPAGPAVVDHLHAATIAVTTRLPLEQTWHAVPCFPTVSEVWLRLLEEFGI
jgi:pyruvate/2-oxoglutarate dehydrogenase complex dihydrolipoamide dehydrogenase (E3) component